MSSSTTTPETMRSLCTLRFGPPPKWEIADLPTPKLERNDDVLVRVHAAAINPTDIGGGMGRYWPAFSIPLPFKIGFDFAGTIIAVGNEVSRLKVGDAVFCCTPFKDGDRFGIGTVSELVLVREEAVILKPKNLSFVEAASIPLVALTAIQMFQKVPEGVRGKTVFVPAALSGVGSIAAQMAKNVYGAEKVITTVSTSKVPMVDELLGKGVVDSIIDYTKVDPTQIISHGSVDVMIDSIGAFFTSLPILKRDGIIVACAGPPPSGTNLKDVSADVSFIIVKVLNLIDTIMRWWISRYHVRYEHVLNRVKGSELESIKGWIEEGKIKPVVGKVLQFADIEGIREEATRIQNQKGGIGKVVIEIIKE